MEITKASGKTEEFSHDKFCASLRDAGAPEDVVREICALVERELEPGATTTKIFRKALRLLVQKNPKAAARYNVRQGLADLGPAGFLFEQYVEIVLRAMEYTTERGIMRAGECVEHEVDVVAKKAEELLLVEAKYRNKRNLKTHIDDVMYADARRGDIERKEGGSVGMWLFTNTKFTSKAIRYGECRTLRMTGWRYPKGKGLEVITAQFALYPVTSLPSVTKDARRIFAEQNMMLAQDIAPYTAQDLETRFGIPSATAQKIAREAHALLT